LLRIRIDKMLDLNWKFLVPFSFVLLMFVALMNVLLRDTSFYAIGMFLSNILLGWVTLEILRRRARAEREKVESHHVVTTSVVHGD
jgi:hypothetical protein